MAKQSVQRRLSAILIADVVGYTKLVERDTDGTVAAWQAARVEVIAPAIAKHTGRIVKLTGDGFLAEFKTVQQAVACAIFMQEKLADSLLEFRMGVNLGDIVDDGQDIHGEGVNIAARIEALADPGGICISGMVHEAVRNRINAVFEDMGEQRVKHVTEPVRVWHWASSPRQKPLDVAPAKAVKSPLALPDRPSIVVLPFDNLSNDPDQDFFADGLTEDLITDLSKVSGLFIVARNSSFAYKGKAVDIRTVAVELGVRYVLEGSVRKSGTRVRINAQLIDVVTGGHMWADRYDGSVDDVFELQDEVGAKVVSALSVKLSPGEKNSLKRVHTNNLEAYELFVRARATPYPPIPERIISARKMFEQVIELDPDFAGGYAGVSSMLSFGAMWSHGDQAAVIERAFDTAQKAISVDNTFGWSYTALGMALMCSRRHEEAIEAAGKAIACQPNDADAHAFLGLIQGMDGQYAVGIDSINQAIRLNPQFFSGPYLNQRGMTQEFAGDYAASVASFKENVGRHGPLGPPALCWAAAAYIGLGERNEAKELTDYIAKNFPKFSMANWNFPPLIRDKTVRHRLIDQMRAAGVPE